LANYVAASGGVSPSKDFLWRIAFGRPDAGSDYFENLQRGPQSGANYFFMESDAAEQLGKLSQRRGEEERTEFPAHTIPLPALAIRRIIFFMRIGRVLWRGKEPRPLWGQHSGPSAFL
jgi:hypothetical protein